jgi:hypothetical protein
VAKKWQRLNVGITPEAFGKLEELRTLVGRHLGKTGPGGVTINQICAWAVHYVLTLPEKQAVKLLVAGHDREQAILNGGNPGTNGTHAHSNKSVPPVGTERVARIKHIPRRVQTSGNEAVQDRQILPMAEL